MDEISLKHEENLSKLLSRAVQMFRQTGLDDLAAKGEKILRNYTNAMSLR